MHKIGTSGSCDFYSDLIVTVGLNIVNCLYVFGFLGNCPTGHAIDVLFYHSDSCMTVSKSVVFMPVCDIWKVNKNEMKCWANGDVLTA
jgi:hypothetical protein